MSYKTLQVRFEDTVCFVQIFRPDAKNTINATLLAELNDVLMSCEKDMNVVVLEGLPEVFCFGADFRSIQDSLDDNAVTTQNPELLYDVFSRLSGSSFVSIAHVRGQTNAGGVGFVAACDIVLSDETATFSLSELLFGLYPACVLPFLARRIGYQKAHYMTLMTRPVTVQKAESWGLVDVCDSNSEGLLRRHILPLKRLSKTGIREYKQYMSELHGPIVQSKALAVTANDKMFSDETNLAKISRFVKTGQYPWEA